MSCSGGSSCRAAEGVSAAGALPHATAKNAIGTSARRLRIAETAFILSSSEIWLFSFRFPPAVSLFFEPTLYLDLRHEHSSRFSNSWVRVGIWYSGNLKIS